MRSTMRMPLILLSLTGLVAGCVSKEDLRSMQADLQNTVTTTRKELKAEIEAAKKQGEEDTQKAVQKLAKDIDGKAIKALTDQKDKIDAVSGELKTKSDALAADIQQLRESDQKLVQQVEAQLAELYKANQQILREFKELRNAVQVTYGGVLDYLKVEEALLKSSLHRVQAILHGVHGTGEDNHAATKAEKAQPSSPPAASQPAEPSSSLSASPPAR
jgi:uncharacterized phage infection (PIP) family protein YhgE